MDKKISMPLSEEEALSLRAGDYVYITGTIYTARDAAHKRMDETLARGEELPLISREAVSITWDHLLPERAVQLVLQAQQQPAEWISMHQSFLI